MTLTIRFDRQQHHATFGPFCWRGEDPYFDLCRLLTDRGWWDEPAVFVDERGVACLTVRSIHAAARHHRPASDADHETNRRLAAERAHRKKRHGGAVGEMGR